MQASFKYIPSSSNMSDFQEIALSLPQEKLLVALENQNLTDFISLLKGRTIDVNYFYGDPENGTLLDIACRSTGTSQFVRILLQHKNINVNAINKTTGLAPIHEAVQNSDEDTLKTLIESTTPNGSICSLNTSDAYGNTALHIAIKQNNMKFLSILLQKCCVGYDINQYTHRNATPLHLALNRGNIEAANKLLEFSEIDLDFQKDSDGRTCRQIIQHQYPELARKISNFTSTCRVEMILFSLLCNLETESFIEVASQVDVEILNENYDYQTFLHYACDFGLADVVDMLLRKQVDPNKKSIHGYTPIMLAAKNCHYDIFVKLLNRSDIRLQTEGVESVLHFVILDMFSQNHETRCEHRKYLELLLNEAVPRGKLDINLQDQDGWTALHYAVLLNDQDVTRLLLKAGAHLYQKNPKGEIPLNSIKAEALADLLDNCITSKNESAFVSDYEIIFDYKIFIQPSLDHIRDGKEMTFFTILERAPELRILLKHPLLKSFLHMKWYLVRKYFFFHFFFIFMFCFMLSWFIIEENQDVQLSDTHSSTNPTNWIRALALLLHNILCFRELLKFSLSPMQYIKSFENALRIVVIVTSGITLIDDSSSKNWSTFAAAAILVSWIQTMLLLGRHPSLSTHIEMLKTVTWNFLKFLLPYSIMIFAFGFSFLILVKNDKKAGKCSTSDSMKYSNTTNFQGFVIKIFELLPMLSGNVDDDFVKLNNEVQPINVFFLLFVFLVSIILCNLLNGLAVSDTKAITEDAELIGIVSQVKFITYLECLMTIPNCHFFQRIPRYIPSCRVAQFWLWRKITSVFSFVKITYYMITLFPDYSEETQIRVLPYRNNIALFLNDDVGGRKQTVRGRILKPYKWEMKQDIVKQAIEVLEKRDKPCPHVNLSQCLKLIQFQQSRIQNMENAIQRVSVQINDLKLEINRKQSRTDA